MKLGQFGASTTITATTRLILMDCFDTLVVIQDGRYVPRNGVAEFLDHFVSARRIPVAVISDAPREAVDTALRQAGIFSKIRDIYHAGNAAEPLEAGRVRKRLDVPLADYRLRPEEVVFIGDSPLDGQAAAHYHVPFIRVPRSEDPHFTFASLIRGPSRYDSGEFADSFLRSFTTPERPPRKP